MAIRVALQNLGCKVNAYELEKMGEALAAEGFRIVPLSERADVVIVNTCTVTQIADHKSRQMLHRARKNNPDALIVASGCYADVEYEALCQDAGIDIVLRNSEKTQIASVLRAYVNNRPGTDQSADQAYGHPDAKDCGTQMPRKRKARTRGFVKIQDGCNLFCSYCIIPHARGRSVSRTEEEILPEIETLARRGIREIVLTGIHLSSYGLDTGTEHALTALLQKIECIDGVERVRLGSLEPRMVDEQTVAEWAKLKKLCPHFHLSLQSGNDEILTRMRRRYTTKEYAKSLALLRQAFEKPAVTTDLIAGFPGETETQFRDGMAFIDSCDFYETHVFPFSARANTPAAAMEGQLTASEKASRVRELIALSQKKAKRFREGTFGAPQQVLWEEETFIRRERYLTGYSERYVRFALKTKPGADHPSRPGALERVYPESFLTDEIILAS